MPARFGRFAVVILLGAWGVVVVKGESSLRPSFAEPIPNTTATVGRKATLNCTVDNLGSFEVAWIKLDTQTLLSLGMKVITHDKRLRVTNSNRRQWFLHIRDVNVLDRGHYMCQVNAEPMLSQAGYLDIMVPPSIEENVTSTDTVVEERERVSLRCGASGYPPPHISWRRENSKDIHLDTVGETKNIVQRVEGEYLNLTQVTREDMGAYLCIASNGVQPSVSKRILLQVNFQPKIRVPNQMIYAVAGSEVTLACNVEASPRPMTSWIRPDEAVLINNLKYEARELEEDSYKVAMQLRIRNISRRDFGPYKCVAKNTFGDKEGFVRIIEIIPTTTTTASTVPFVFIPVRVVSQTPATTDSPTSPKRDLGVPTTNSLRDQSHLVSSEKQLLPGKVENRLEDEKQRKRMTLYNSNFAKTTNSVGFRLEDTGMILAAAGQLILIYLNVFTL